MDIVFAPVNLAMLVILQPPPFTMQCLSGSQQKVILRPLVGLMNCGFGQRLALTDFLGMSSRSLQDYKSGHLDSAVVFGWVLNACTPGFNDVIGVQSLWIHHIAMQAECITVT